MIRLALNGLVLATVLSGCSDDAPPCPFSADETRARSAGCFSLSTDGLLLVQGLNGRVSLPGGSSKWGESARCTAFRETWEETGLHLEPRELLAVFDTGFHLYRCQRTERSGTLEPPLDMEVRDVFYLPPDEFDDHQWRFPSQKVVLRAFFRQ